MIAGATKAEGHSVSVCDLNLACYLDGSIRHAFWERDGFDAWYEEGFLDEHWHVIHRLLSENVLADGRWADWDVIGIHVNYAARRVVDRIAIAIKALFPNVRIALGGPACFFSSEADFSFEVDAVFRGEAEHSWLKWLSCGMPRGVISPIVGDMDTLPTPDFSIFAANGYRRGQTLPIETSRGCVNRCAFCSDVQLWGRCRMKSVSKIGNDLEQIRSFGAARVSCVDSLVNPTTERLLSILPTFAASGLRWDGMFQVRGLSEDIVGRLRDAGCDHVFLGVESFSPTVLRHLRKAHVSKNAASAIRGLANAGISVTIGMIVAGPPFQTKEEFVADIDLAVGLAAHLDSVALNPLCIPVGTPLDGIASKLGVLGVNEDDGWKHWYAIDRHADVARRYDWCCDAIAALKANGVRVDSDKESLAKFFGLNQSENLTS